MLGIMGDVITTELKSTVLVRCFPAEEVYAGNYIHMFAPTTTIKVSYRVFESSIREYQLY